MTVRHAPSNRNVWIMDIYDDARRLLDHVEAKCAKLAGQPPEGWILAKKPGLSTELARLRKFAANFRPQLAQVIHDNDDATLADFERALPELAKAFA